MPVAARLIEQLMAGRPDPAMCPPEAIAWHNTDEVDGLLATGFERMAAIRRVLPDFRFDKVVALDADGDVSVARYILKATLPDGSQLRVPGCLVVTAPGGVVSRSEEYVDTAQLAPLAAVLRPPTPS